METNLDFGRFPTIAVPTVKAWNSKAWKGELSVWTNRVGESVAKALTQKKLFQQVKRVDTEEPLALAGAVTFFHDGSATYGAVFGPASGAKNQNFLQAEFKVMAHGKQVGVIQAHGVQGQNWIALTAAASVEDQIGRAVAEAMKRIKEQKTTGEATQDAVMAGWFME